MKRLLNQFSTRITHLQAEGAYAVLAKARALEAQGKKIVHLEIGQPDFETFTNIGLAGIRAIANGKTRYTSPAGMMELRTAIANYAAAMSGISVRPEEVVVGPGAKPLLYFPLMAILEPGDEVLYPDPGFPTYTAIIRQAGAVPVPLPLVEDKNFAFDLNDFRERITEKTRLIMLNSPSNPTGGVIPYDDLCAILEAAERYNCWILSDEIYQRLAYGNKVTSIASLPGARERTIIVDGFSKTYAMTGWRLGYGIMPAGLAEKVGLQLTHSIGCTASFTQVAGVEALTGPQDQVERVRQEYQERRDLIVEGLNAIPNVSCQLPQGAFYVFPNIKHFGLSSSRMADLILEKAGVAVLPGTAFGQYGEGYLRLCYSNSKEEIQLALSRIETLLNSL
ncbi:MAG: pyridoxal phosphate-dependent aminotransferase [Anaerolineales bacterium]|nr:pyridoxal phosphate-dependent aminotransferase [Anaerolineales bacterium]